MEERLQKLIAAAGIASRREAERMITAGRVKVNGLVVVTAGFKADLDRDRVEVDGRMIGRPEAKVYYMLNKPSGYVTTLKDPQGRPTVLLFFQDLPIRVYPVGRLDMDAEGLMVLTNDGDLAKHLMHPSTHVPKTYRVKVEGHPNPAALRKLGAGEIIVGERPVLPARVEVVKTGEGRTWLHLTITEGRYHQIKRMCQAVGHRVLKLKRVEFGPLKLGRLALGERRELKPNEIDALWRAVKAVAKGKLKEAGED